MDRDGGRPRQLTDDRSAKFYPSWSPDEKWIAYSARPVNEPDDSLAAYAIRADSPGKPQRLGKGQFIGWYGEKAFVLWSPSGTIAGTMDRPERVRISPDSIFAIPVLEGRYVAALDWHAGRTGWLITTAESYRASGLAKARRLTSGISFATFVPGTGDFYYVLPRTSELRRVLLPGGPDRLVGRYPGLRVFFSISTETGEIAYTENYRKMRFVLVDNLFQ
jgi:hypothetical protein